MEWGKDWGEPDEREIEELREQSEREEIPSEWEPCPETIQVISGKADPEPLMPERQEQQEIIESLSQIEGLKPEAWKELNEAEERLSVLQDAEKRIAELQGRPPAEVVSYEAGPGEFGHYNPETNQISIGAYSLQNDNVKEVADTTIHEGRHAYQCYAAEHPGMHPNPSEVEEWRENLKPGNYLTAAEYGQELYESQPVEADAWRYARRITDGL